MNRSRLSTPIVAVITFCSLASWFVQARSRTDVIVLKNGDQITCEIKSLGRGRLSASTSYMGTVSIEWEEVQSIQSVYDFDIETQAGTRYFGSIDAPEADEKVRVRLDQTAVPLTRDSVIRMRPIDYGFWDKVDGRVDLGFNFQKANNNTAWNLGAEIGRRTRKQQGKLSYSSQLTTRDDVSTTTRNVLSFSFDRFLQNRWFGTGFFQATQNSELNIDLRTTYGGTIGRYFIQSNEALISWNLGMVLSREQFDEMDAEAMNSVEGVAGLRLEFFRFDNPEIDISTNLLMYPSFSDFGRVRIDFDTRVAWEIFNDFDWNVTYYQNFDSRPPSMGAVRNDYGITTGVSWSY